MKDVPEVNTETILQHLEALVSADSSDPQRTMTPDHPALIHAGQTLKQAGFEVTITDHGDGCVNLLAVRADPTILFNCHLDTVKPNPGWTRDPFKLSIENDRAYALGACDIKGAAACLLAVAQSTDAPIAILFTTDEEAGKGKCVESFLEAENNSWSRVVVAEPTESKVVSQHRGFASFEIEFAGQAGHTSKPDASGDSAIHKAIEWGRQALNLTKPNGPLHHARFNIGLIEGGTASNVIAANAKVRFGFRPLPSPDAISIAKEAIDALHQLLPTDGTATWTDRFVGPALVCDESMKDSVHRWDIETGPDVDFWTEAALFAAGGVHAVVLGPGSIAQAHAADEFVELAQLEHCARAYAKIIKHETHAELSAGGAHAP